jgi:hypothetical protein
MKALAILIDPRGDESFIAYGSNTKDKDSATRFLNGTVAIRAARSRIFGDPDAFWNSEREHARRTRKEYRGWSYRIEEIGE